MTRLLVFLILSLSFAVSVQAQKVHRAAKAMYELKFDKQIGETDKVFEVNNVRIAVEKKSFLYLAGTILEFSGGLNGKGFVFNNPNASRTCGCGESFSL